MRTLALLFFFLFSVSAFAQEPDIDQYLSMVANGKLKEVKSQLPDLLVDYPDNPGVKLLLAVVIEDAYKALDIYKQIAKDYPESKWADDAYWRIVQFYAVQGDTDKAKSELRYFRVKYPESPYIIPASEVVRISEGVSRNTNKVVKTKHSEAIGRDNKRVEEPKETIKEEKIEKAESPKTGLQDFTSKENSKVSESKPLEKPEPTELEKEKPVDLAFNNSNHKVIRKKVAEEEKKEENPAKAAMIEQQNKMVSNITEKDEKADIASNDIEQKKETAEENVKEVAKAEVENKAVTEGNSGFYGLQVAVFEDIRKANAEKAKFLKKRMRTNVVPKSIDDNTLYAVVIGNYSSLESANAAKIIVKQQCDCDPIVFEK